MKECFTKGSVESFHSEAHLSLTCAGPCPGCWRPDLFPALRGALRFFKLATLLLDP